MAGVKGRSGGARVGVGRGGARPGSGAKRKDGVERDRCGRIKRLPVPCACGGVRNSKAAACLICHRAAKSRKPRACSICGANFTPKSARVATCSSHCSNESRRRTQGFTVDNCSARERERRRRASKMRQKRGGATGRKVVRRWERIIARDGAVCGICNEPIDVTLRLPAAGAPTADHVIPLAHGGSDEDDNLRPSHFRCNSRRGAQDLKRIRSKAA